MSENVQSEARIQFCHWWRKLSLRVVSYLNSYVLRTVIKIILNSFVISVTEKLSRSNCISPNYFYYLANNTLTLYSVINDCHIFVVASKSFFSLPIFDVTVVHIVCLYL